MNAAAFLLATTLVLWSGDRIAVDGTVREEDGVVTFRAGGTLYSMPAAEIARITTDERPPAAVAPPVVRLRVSSEEKQRLIAELEKNHSGAAAPPEQKVLPEPPPRPDVEAQTREEWAWRRDARAHEEAVRRAREELALLEERADVLRSKIHALVAQGFKPRQFTYDTTELARTLERIPYAELEVVRAERALTQFREDARRQGILPGWLR
jgi:hypothetical protein